MTRGDPPVDRRQVCKERVSGNRRMTDGQLERGDSRKERRRMVLIYIFASLSSAS
jgi:hypothetical protein